MKQITTQGIILARTDYAEADRILKILTPDHGKVSAIAKGVRKSKSKLAGSIEFFSVADLSFIIGKSEIHTITSARLIKHHDNIVKELERTNAAYDFIKQINKHTADNPESAYFELLDESFEALDDLELDSKITSLWFNMKLLKLSGMQPNLSEDINGDKLESSSKYNFDSENMKFAKSIAGNGLIDANKIKFLRLGFAASRPQILDKVKEKSALVDWALSFVRSLQSVN